MGTAVNPVTNREAFVQNRRSFLGGSDIAAAMGVGDYSCDLRVFNEKRGIEPTAGQFFGNSATERGNWLEDVAAQWFSHKTGFIMGEQVRKVRTPKAHPDFAFMRPQPDYEIIGVDRDLLDASGKVVNSKRGPGLLSVKVPGGNMFSIIKNDGLSYEYICQLQYELAIWRREWGAFEFFAVINDKIQSLEFYVAADPEIGKAATDAAQNLWRVVENGPAPQKKDVDSKACRRCPYKLDCHDEDLLKLLATENAGTEIVQKAELDPLLEELVELEQMKKDAEALVDAKKAEVEAIMGDTQIAMASRYKVTFLPRSKETFQDKPFFEKHADLKAERDNYLKVSAWKELRKYALKSKGATE